MRGRPSGEVRLPTPGEHWPRPVREAGTSPDRSRKAAIRTATRVTFAEPSARPVSPRSRVRGACPWQLTQDRRQRLWRTPRVCPTPF
jgi:hypothetical protein